MKPYFSGLPLIAVLFACPAYAQTAPDQQKETAETVVITASRTQLDAREIGSAITVATEADIQRGQILFLKDVLQDMPGVQITSDRPGGFNNVSIRGSDNDQVLFLLDGIELGDPSSISTQFQSDHLTSLDIARVEVLRGDQSSLYGSDAIGGVVNIITQRATEEGFHINAEAEGGSENTRSGGITLLGKHGGVDYRLTGTTFAADGPSLADPLTGPAREDDGYERRSVSGRLGAQIVDGFSAQVLGFYSETSSDLDNSNSDSSDTVDKDEYAAAAQLTYAAPGSGWRNELTISRYSAKSLYFGTFNRPQGDLYDGVKDAALFTTSYHISPMFDIAGGLNWEKEKTTQETSFSGEFLADITTKSAFVELAVRPVENLSFTAAARVDDNSRFGAFDTYRITGAYFMPGLLAGGDVKFRASYGTGAKAPGLYQLFDPTYGEPTLEVETSEGYDAGVDISWARAQLELTVFSTDVTNEIGFDGSKPPFGGYAQFGSTELRGAEFGGRFELTSWATLTQSLTVLDSEDSVTHLWKKRPRYSGSTGVTFQLTPAWDLTARLRYRTENASGFGGVTEGFQTLDLLTSYAINEKFELYARIVNVADKEYELSYGSNSPDRGYFAGLRVRL